MSVCAWMIIVCCNVDCCVALCAVLWYCCVHCNNVHVWGVLQPFRCSAAGIVWCKPHQSTHKRTQRTIVTYTTMYHTIFNISGFRVHVGGWGDMSCVSLCVYVDYGVLQCCVLWLLCCIVCSVISSIACNVVICMCEVLCSCLGVSQQVLCNANHTHPDKSTHNTHYSNTQQCSTG